MITKAIRISHQFEGFHKYENAPKEVAFLKNLHRHIFHVIAIIEVTDNDREIEFFMAKKYLREVVTEICAAKPFLDSCEQIAEWITNALAARYGYQRRYTVEVSEDDENGGLVSYIPDAHWHA